MRLQTLQSYDGRDVPGNFDPTTQIATNKFSVLSQGNLRPMSKNVLKTLLILDFQALGRGRRFQYATYGPPAPDGGRTIKEYAVRLALDRRRNWQKSVGSKLVQGEDRKERVANRELCR